MKDLPTNEEQLSLRESEILMKRNLAQMKISEMLHEVKCDLPSKGSSKWKCLQKMISILMNAGDEDGVDATFLKTYKLKSLSLVHHNKEHEIQLNFKAPTSIEFGGSYVIGTQTKPFINYDLYVIMPDECFESDDVRDYIYFDKRSLYLAVLIKLILDNELAYNNDVHIAYLKGDERKPIITFESSNKHQFRIRLIPTLSGKSLNIKRLKASKNNIRPKSWLLKLSKNTKKRKKIDQDDTLDHTQLIATPNYNMSIIEDITMIPILEIFKDSSRKFESFRDAVILFKIWSQQNALRNLIDGIDSHIGTILFIHLLHINKNSAYADSIALFQMMLKYLIGYDFKKSNTLFRNSNRFNYEDINSCDETNFLWFPYEDNNNEKNVSVYMNLLWRISDSAICEIKRIAQNTFQSCQLNSELIYEIAFAEKTAFTNRYDVYFSIPIMIHDDNNDNDNDELSNNNDLICLTNKITKTMTNALGNRIKYMRVLPSYWNEENLLSQNCNGYYPLYKSDKITSTNKFGLFIGLVLDQDHINRRVERGPTIDNMNAGKEFQSFWGENKSELRKFQDGGIINAVVWNSSNGTDIIEEISKYILGHHFPIYCGNNGEYITFSGLPISNNINKNISQNETKYKNAIKSFDSIRDILISKLTGLPLKILTLSAASSMLRYTSLITPYENTLLTMASNNKVSKNSASGDYISRVIIPIKIIGTLEESSKWPQDQNIAIKLKTAFILQICNFLDEQHRIKCAPHENSLDIFYNGYIFRLQLITSSERDRIRKFHSEHVDIESKILSLEPLHHSVIRSLHGRFKCYGDTTRLFQYSLSKSLFSNHLSLEMIELLVAAVFINDNNNNNNDDDENNNNIPTTAQNAFRRTLKLLISYDWNNLPLILDFNNSITMIERKMMEKKFEDKRKMKSISKPIYIVSSYDRINEFEPLIDYDQLENVVFRMIINAAIKSINKFDELMAKSLIYSINDIHMIENIIDQSLVSTNYNTILNFNRSLICKQNDNNWEDNIKKGPSFARLKLFSNLSKQELSLKKIICRNTSVHQIQSEIVHLLKLKYGKYALFFWDEINGDKLGMIWRPHVFLPTRFSVLETKHHLINPDDNNDNDNEMMIFNVGEVMAEILYHTNGAVDDITYL